MSVLKDIIIMRGKEIIPLPSGWLVLKIVITYPLEPDHLKTKVFIKYLDGPIFQRQQQQPDHNVKTINEL